jgi:hypothetical protein
MTIAGGWSAVSSSPATKQQCQKGAGMTIIERPSPWLTWQQLLQGPIQRRLINEPLDFEVDFEVAEAKLTATERAQQRWFKRGEGDEKV